MRSLGISQRFERHSLKHAALFLVAAFFGMSFAPKGSILAWIALAVFGCTQLYFGLILYAKYWQDKLANKRADV